MVLESPGLRKILKVKILVVRILHPKRIWASNRPDGDKELGERDRCELIPGNIYSLSESLLDGFIRLLTTKAHDGSANIGS